MESDGMDKEGMDKEELTKISRALADKNRLRIYEAIAMRDWVDCGELVNRAGLAPGTVSHHLKVLAGAHLIVRRRGHGGRAVHLPTFSSRDDRALHEGANKA